MTVPAVGDRVKIERDEQLYPSKGTWPYYRGKTGTVVEHNLGEIGASFGKVTPTKDPVKAKRALRWEPEDVHWFQPHEVTATGRSIPAQSPQRAAGSPHNISEGYHTRELLTHA
jgi:hypothetical protein